MNRRCVEGPFQPSLEDALCATVGDLRRRDALAAIYVLVPTHLLGRYLMRTIASRHGVCFNVRFHTFPDLAEVTGAQQLVASGRLPLPSSADYLVARKAVAAKIAADGYFGPIRDFPSTPRAILSTISDLQRAGISASQLREFAQARASRKLAELAAVYDEATRLRHEAGYFDPVEQLEIAATAAPASPLFGGALALCLYGFRELNFSERQFLAGCLASGVEARAFVPDDVAGRTAPLLEWLASNGFTSLDAAAARDASPSAVATRANEPARVRIVSAPGVEREVEEMGRQILDHIAAPGASFSDVAILLRHPAAYERTIRDVFEGAGIPHVFVDGMRLSTTLTGRLLRLLLRIRLEDYPRREVMEFLGLIDLRATFTREFPEASVADWERYSREAGIVHGRDHWRRVREMRRRVEWRAERLRKEAADSGAAALERDARSLRVFERVVNSLLKRLSTIPDRGTIAALMGQSLRTLLALAVLPEAERAAVRAINSMVGETVADEEVSIQAFATLTDDILGERLPPSDVYRSGRVVVSSLTGAFGLPHKVVLIPGLVERAFPSPPRQDPVLLDHERRDLAGAFTTLLATRETQAADEQFGFHHAVAAGSAQVTLSYPRLDAATGHTRVPSHFLLQIAEKQAGTPLDYRGLERQAERIPVGRLDPAGRPLTPVEWDVAIAYRALGSKDAAMLFELPGYAALARGVRAEAQRWEEHGFTEHDGLLGVGVPLPRTLSATQLEAFGVCPFKFYGQRVLGVVEVEEPEEVETLTPLDRGSIIHDILEEFLRGLVRDSLLPYDRARAEEYRARLRAVAEDTFRKFEASGAVGYPFMWTVERERMRADLEGFLASELDEAQGFVPTYFEARFGPTASGRPQPPGSTSRALELPVGGQALRFTGYIDRIDLHRGGAARVIDYKSGKVHGVKNDLFRGGQTLQLPLYMLAADIMLEANGQTARAVEAHYYYVTGRGGFQRARFSRAALDRRREEFDTIVRAMAESMASGVYPQNPGKTGENCQWCEFQPACGHGRAALVARKTAVDPRIDRLRAMWRIE